MVDVAVLPPQKGDVSPSEEEDSVDEKEGVHTHTKEIDVV